MRPVRLKMLLIILSGLFLFSKEAVAQTVTNLTQNSTYGSDIQDAINNANPGDVIELSNGTYVLNYTLVVDRPLTIQGVSEAGVILDASGMTPITSRVIKTDADDVTLRNFTIIPITDPDTNADNSIGFTIKAGGNSIPTINKNLTLANITIEGAESTPFDIHAVDGVSLTDLTANNTSKGNGINITGCTDVEISGFSGSNNAWGAIGIYASRFFNRPSQNVNIDGPSLSIDDVLVSPNCLIYYQDDLNPMEGDLINTDITVSGWCYTVTNPDFRYDGIEFTFFADILENAELLAQNLDDINNSSSSDIKETLTCTLEELPLMDGAEKVMLILIVLSIAVVMGYRRLA